MSLRLLAAAVLLAFSPAAAASTCPAAGEAAADCPWAGIARTLAKDAAQDRPVGADLARLAPGIAAQLKADAARGSWLALWGESVNFDEHAQAVIVDPAILAALASRLGLPYRDKKDRRVHAGLEHTYGYLFSTLQTPYGFKRARWVDGELERGLGLPEGLLGPAPKEGTLLSNAAYAMGRVAFRDDEPERAALEAGSTGTPAALRNYSWSALAVDRVTETVVLADSSTVALRTDLVVFPRPTGGKDARWLVYSTRQNGKARLITAFPVEEAFAQSLLEPAKLGTQRVTTRYNAFVPGLTGKSLPGTRAVSETGRRGS